MYQVNGASGDAYTQSNLGKGHNTIEREQRERAKWERRWREERGVQRSSGLMIYCTRFFEITSRTGEKKYKQETEREK